MRVRLDSRIDAHRGGTRPVGGDELRKRGGLTTDPAKRRDRPVPENRRGLGSPGRL